jgi:Cu(I)/Ag(I) efflux system membrane protein CusA/SilA
VAVGTGPGGVPVTVGDVATVQLGPEQRRGIADLTARRGGHRLRGDALRRNPLAVIDGVKAKMREVERSLPGAWCSSPATTARG